MVHLHYRGRNPEEFNIDWVELVFLKQALGMLHEGGEVKAIIALPGIPEVDVCFWHQSSYLSFWRRCRALWGRRHGC